VPSFTINTLQREREREREDCIAKADPADIVNSHKTLGNTKEKVLIVSSSAALTVTPGKGSNSWQREGRGDIIYIRTHSI
jgi:hypothetical protein